MLWYLSGLTCTHENAMVKAGAQRWAAEHGIALVFPDTSPRGEGVPDDEACTISARAPGFYVNATQAPWAAAFPDVGLRRRKSSRSVILHAISPSTATARRSLAIPWAGTAR